MTKNIGITGHSLRSFQSDDNFTKEGVLKIIDTFVSQFNGKDVRFHLGGASGIDNWVGQACVKYEIPYNIYLPKEVPEDGTKLEREDYFNSQGSMLSGINKNELDIAYNVYSNSLATIVSPGMGTAGRNHLIVDNSDILYCGLMEGNGYSGTGQTVWFALQKGIKVFNILYGNREVLDLDEYYEEEH